MYLNIKPLEKLNGIIFSPYNLKQLRTEKERDGI